ncbi:MAG: histidine kinase [Saprospiraceae bacterium]
MPPRDFNTSEIVFLISAGILIMVVLALVMLAFASQAQRRILQQRMDAQAMELEHQQALVQRNLASQEEERQRIAAHLHDDIGSKLGVLSLSFHRLSRMGPEVAERLEMVDEINGLIAQTMGRVRSISHELLPPTLEDFGLIEAIKELAEQLRKTGSLDIRFDFNLVREELGSAVTELHLFRMVQELANNTLKYAGATLISIELLKTEQGKSLIYQDNGQGFDPSEIQSKGMGLKNLQSRTRIIEGCLEVDTSPGNGFRAAIQF